MSLRGDVVTGPRRRLRLVPPEERAPLGPSLVTAIGDVLWWVLYGGAMLLVGYAAFCARPG